MCNNKNKLQATRSELSMRNPVLVVQVHGTDQLKQDPYLSHPVVKVHAVDANTGAYLRKAPSVPCVML